MQTITIYILDRAYQLACEEGQEARLRELGGQLNDCAHQIAKAMPDVSEHLLLVMVALMMADGLDDAKADIATLRQQLMAGGAAPVTTQTDTNRYVEAFRDLANRAETLANQLESA